MVRFSCFHASVNPKPKKTVQLSTEAMHKTLEDHSQTTAFNDFNLSKGKSPENGLNSGVDNISSHSSNEQDWKSEGLKSKNDNESDVGVQKGGGHIRKSLSLGSGLDWKGRASADNESDDGSNRRYSCASDNPVPDHYQEAMPSEYLQVSGLDWKGRASADNESDDGSNRRYSCASDNPVPNHYQEAMPSESLQVSSNVGNNESEREGDFGNSETRLSGEEGTCGARSSNRTPLSPSPPAIVKSNSWTDLGTCGVWSVSAYRVPSSRSCDDLNVLDSRRKDMSMHEVGMIQDQERNSVLNIDPKNGEHENAGADSYDPYNDTGSAKDWIVPVTDELNKGKNVEDHSLDSELDELPSKDFRIKRIEKWVMDLQHCSQWEETDIPSSSDFQPQSDDIVDGLGAPKIDAKATPGMEAAKKYISSLSMSATTAQLANHGLVVIPFMSAFVSLKTLNLSGNAIVRITAGALPRGLHSLNLPKNNISTIEGLRELTRLRVLDLSYNRILRIGHGLASCSSLKELYLAGNKISEVEGLHRLLKLNVLDLRFNKLSTTKSLGQLAANYSSLQAISLEGNPAQKNVGDEQLKKYLQSLLPHLAYFNRHSIKSGTGMKDGADRSARLGISVHQTDRGLRSDLKNMRKVNHAAAAPSSHKIVSSGRKTGVSPKPSRGSRHGRLPPSGIKTASRGQQFYDWSSKLLSFQADLAIRRSRSEGTLGVI